MYSVKIVLRIAGKDHVTDCELTTAELFRCLDGILKAAKGRFDLGISEYVHSIIIDGYPWILTGYEQEEVIWTIENIIDYYKEVTGYEV